MLKDRRNPFCYYGSGFGWGGLVVLIFGGFSFGYGFSNKNFTAHRKGLIIAGGVAFGIIGLGITTCVVASWCRKKAAARDEENLVVRPPRYAPPMTGSQDNPQPPMTAHQSSSLRDVGTDSQQRSVQHSGAQQTDVDALLEQPPPAYSERLGDRVCDPNPSSMLNV